MWKCLNCSEDVDDKLVVCWHCQADKLGVMPDAPVAAKDDDSELKRFLNEKHRPKNCIRCDSKLKFAGTKEFQDGINWGALGDFGELFVSHTSLEMYICPECLRVEFFVSEPDV